MKWTSQAFAGLLVAVIFTVAARAEVKVETVLTGLDNPCGVAVQPGTGHVFVSDSAAGRIVKFDPASPGKVTPVIVDFPLSTYGKGPIYKIGPLGLAFADKNTLVVGGGGQADGAELLRVYDLSKGGTLKASAMKHSIGPIKPKEGVTIKGEGNFYGVAIVDGVIYITCNGDDTKGWVSTANLGDKKPVLKPTIATKEATEVDAPVGIAIDPKKKFVVVGQMGEISKPKDGLLTFYNVKNGKMTMNLETGLYDIASLAYSPTGRLYAADFAWMAPAAAGVYRLDSTGDKKSVKSAIISKLDKPSALAFGKDGALYVTVFGTAKKGSKKKPGSLVKITGKL